MEEYSDLPLDVVPPNDTELWEHIVGGRHKGRIIGFGTSQDSRYAMSNYSSVGLSGSSHREEKVCLSNME